MTAIQILEYFLAIVCLWMINRRLHSLHSRQVLFLIVSYLLYASWGPWFLAVLIFSSLMNYQLGQLLRRRPTTGRLWLGITFNLLFLSIFKYLPLVGRLVTHSPTVDRLSHLVLPVGISFWTFQALSYLFDLYREEELDASLLEFCLYMAFWPTVLSGPICRLPDILPQFRQSWSATWEDLSAGLKRISIGGLMLLVAQLMGRGLGPGQGVDAGFDRFSTSLGGLDVWCLAIGFGFQLFFDFCGYSHIVIGAARMFAIRLQENFDHPYLSTTTSMFWTRWHMSLSFWIRDYLFLPLASLRREREWRTLALIFSMVLFGLWHRASLLFIFWGAYHGMLLVLHRQWQQLERWLGFRWDSSLATLLSWLVTFGSVNLGWVFFRASQLGQAGRMLKAIVVPASYFHFTLPYSFYVLLVSVILVYFSVLGIARMDRMIKMLPAGAAAWGDARPASRGPSTVLSIISKERWVLMPPVVVVLAFYVLIMIRPERTTASPFLYRMF